MRALGKTYDQMQPRKACSLFVLPPPAIKPKAVRLPQPRSLLPQDVHEQNGRESYYIDARITVGWWLWARTIDAVIRSGL